MTKKEKTLVTISSIYLIGLLLLMVMILLCSIFKFLDAGLVIIIFFVYLICGYIVVTLLRIKTYEYICKKCNHQQKMTFTQAVFAKRGDNTRILKCNHCGQISDLERTAI